MALKIVIVIALLAAEFVFATLFCRAGWPKSTKKGFFFKMAASSVFLISGILCGIVSKNESYRNLIIAGLALGWIGDVFMTFDPFLVNKSKAAKAAAGVMGGLAFLAGHIFYIIAFFMMLYPGSSKTVCALVIMIAVLMGVVIVIKSALRVKLGKLAPAVAIYAVMLLTMLSSAWLLAVTGGESAPFGAAAAAGPMLFVVSDFTLALKLFAGKRFDTLGVRRIYIYTYFFAQMLIAGSIALI